MSQIKPNNIDIKLLQYSAIDGIPTLTDSEVMGLFLQIEKDNLVKTVFYDGTIKTEFDFLTTMKHGMVQLFVVLVDGKASGIMWLSEFEVRSASFNYCFFKSVMKMNLVKIAKKCIIDLFNIEKDGKPIFDVLTGITPETNRAANIWNRKMKFNILGKIPKACWIEERQESVSGTVCYLERGIYG